MIDRWSADSDYRLNLESYGLEQLSIVVFGVPSADVPARFFRVQDFGLMPRVQSMWTAKVQGTARAQNAVELGDHIPVAKQMLQHFKADDFIKCPSLVRQIVKIVLFEPQARRVCPFVNDQKVACFEHLLLHVIHRYDTRAGLICQPGEIPVPATSIQYVAGPGLPEMAQRSTVTRV